MAVKCSPFGPKPQFVDANGAPYSGALLFFYASGSATKQNTYTDSTGGTSNANPVVLDSSGRPSNQIWFTEGLTYKVVLAPSTDSDPPTSPIFTVDGLTGINDTTTSADEWVASGVTPTYVSATSFTLSGDQTSAFHVGRRTKSTVTAGTIYSVISASSYNSGTALTTVTVVNDSGTLDSGLSAVSLGLLRSDNPSVPILTDTRFIVSGSSDKTKKVRIEIDGLTTGTTRVLTVPDADIVVAGSASALTSQTIPKATTGGLLVDGPLTCGSNNEVNNTSQPAFLAKPSAGATDVTGDGTSYNVVLGTEVFDQGSNFASNTFTAPVTGRYQLSGMVHMSGLLSTHTSIDVTISTSNRDYRVQHVYGTNPLTELGIPVSILADMDAADTAVIQARASNGTKVVDIDASKTYFSGYLAC